MATLVTFFGREWFIRGGASPQTVEGDLFADLG